MNVYTFSEARQQLSSILEQAAQDGEVQIKRRDGQKFTLKPMKSTKSPLDISGINIPVSSKDIVDVIREMRERNK
jgi:hypothetical protein